MLIKYICSDCDDPCYLTLDDNIDDPPNKCPFTAHECAWKEEKKEDELSGIQKLFE